MATVRAPLQQMGQAAPERAARHFARARTASVQPLMEALTAPGQARAIEGRRFAA